MDHLFPFNVSGKPRNVSELFFMALLVVTCNAACLAVYVAVALLTYHGIVTRW